MLITLGGKAGSGKGTVGKLLAENLGYQIISIGDMRRKLAAEMGINIIEFNKIGDSPEKAAEFDLKYEEYQKKLNLNDNIILDSRLGFYAQPHAFRILLDVDENEAGKRIFNANRGTDKTKSKKEAIKEVKERNKGDAERYKKLYNIDVWDYNNYSLIIDTTNYSPEEVLEIILNEFKSFKIQKGIAETSEEKKLLHKTNKKKKLIKDIALLVALILMTLRRIFTIMNEQKKLENQQNIDDINQIIEEIE